MGGKRFDRGLARKSGWARGVHALGFRCKQRNHLAVVLIALAVCAPLRADDIGFNPATTDAEFARFSRLVAQAIFPTPVQAARTGGLLGFDVGVALTGVKVDSNASYWKHAVTKDFSTHGYVGVPRIVVVKGFEVAAVSASYAQVSNSGIKTYGGAIDVPVMRGGLAAPEIALRASCAAVTGATRFGTKVYGVEAFISKGFGPLTPYAAVGRVHTDAHGTIRVGGAIPDQSLNFKGDMNRYTAGVRFSLFVPKIGVEVTKAEVTSIAAKVSFGF